MPRKNETKRGKQKTKQSVCVSVKCLPETFKENVKQIVKNKLERQKMKMKKNRSISVLITKLDIE